MPEDNIVKRRKSLLIKDWKIWISALLILASVLFLIDNSKEESTDTLVDEPIFERETKLRLRILKLKGNSSEDLLAIWSS